MLLLSAFVSNYCTLHPDNNHNGKPKQSWAKKDNKTRTRSNSAPERKRPTKTPSREPGKKNPFFGESYF